jgi:hypothetical protein
MNRKNILWAAAAFLAGGAFAARQNIINNQKGQLPPAVKKKTAETPPPAPPLPPKEHPVSVILIAQMPKDGNAKDIGCGNTTKAMVRKSTFTGDPVQDALEVLFALTKAGYENGELYNALYQSDLKVQSVHKSGGVVTVKLSGTLKMSGECDIPRIKAQIEETIMAASKTKKIKVFVNNKNLDEAVSLKG